jgi:hypothetical protein
MSLAQKAAILMPSSTSLRTVGLDSTVHFPSSSADLLNCSHFLYLYTVIISLLSTFLEKAGVWKELCIVLECRHYGPLGVTMENRLRGSSNCSSISNPPHFHVHPPVLAYCGSANIDSGSFTASKQSLICAGLFFVPRVFTIVALLISVCSTDNAFVFGTDWPKIATHKAVHGLLFEQAYHVQSALRRRHSSIFSSQH